MRNKWLTYIVLSIFLLILFFPLIYIVSSSFKESKNLFEYPFRLISDTFTYDNYMKAWRSAIKDYFWNSLIVALISTGSNVFFATIAGFTFAKYRFRGRNLIFSIIILTTIVPFDYNIIPLYIVIKKLGLINTYLGIALPGLVTSIGIFLMRQFAQQIPNELIEAARIDGASDYRIVFRLVFPLLKSGMATLAILTFLASWDNFLWAIISVSRSTLYTLPIGLSVLSGDPRSFDYPALMAGVVISIAPIIVMFLVFQKYIMESQISTGIKG